MPAPRLAMISFSSEGPRTITTGQIEHAFSQAWEDIRALGRIYELVGPSGSKVRIVRDRGIVQGLAMLRYVGPETPTRVSVSDWNAALANYKRQIVEKIEENLSALFESQDVTMRAYSNADGTLAQWQSGSAQRTATRTSAGLVNQDEPIQPPTGLPTWAKWTLALGGVGLGYYLWRRKPWRRR